MSNLFRNHQEKGCRECESAYKKSGDYISGPHHFWIHFGCGLVFGALLSGCISCQLFESPALILASVALTSLVIAYCCGRWGDPVWQWIIGFLTWIPWFLI